MSRIVKLRLWCTQSKEFIDPRKFVIDGYGDIFIIQSSGGLIRASSYRFLLSLSTGCFDKNGKEVYEEDIVKAKNPAGEENNYLVKWAEEGMVFIGNNEGEIYDLGTYQLKKSEVIGNIYENPEHKHLLGAHG